MSTMVISSSPEVSSFTNPPEMVPIQTTTTTTTDSSSLLNSTQTPTTQDPIADDETGKRKISESEQVPTAAGATTNNRSNDEVLALSNLIDQDLTYIIETSNKLVKYKDHVIEQVKEAQQQLDALKKSGNPKELRDLKKTVTKLKVHISSKYKNQSEDDPRRNKRSNVLAKIKMISDDKLLEEMPQLYKSQVLESSQFQDFKNLYDGLRTELKLCLLCFAVFPEDAIIKKRLMVYWWIGEQFVPPIPSGEGAAVEQIPSGKTAEDFANEFFHELMDKGFIEPVYKKRSLVADSCKMHPFIHSIVVLLAVRAKFFDFGLEGNPTEEFSTSHRACLVGDGLANQQDLEKLHMLFNVNEEILDFKPEWFLKMRNINLLYLGRWQISATHHIEVEETNFLDGLEIMNYLRLFSLQGVSRIMELPESISQLSNLTILDLRACHNLELIPKGIGLLKRLTHLDMSECYLLEHMPKELSLLSELQVFKGFVVGASRGKSSCTLDDLAKLPNLRKLNIYTGLKEFPTETHLRALQQFQALSKLTIAWGGGASQGKLDNISNTTKKDDGEGQKKPNSSKERSQGLTKKPRAHKPLTRSVAFKSPTLDTLEKLDLQCFPGKRTTDWLTSANLKGLKKLYIRGGTLSDLGQYQDLAESIGDVLPVKDKWKIEVLRLKYLSELEMDWREMQELFPDLLYLEKVNCPKLTFFPCDESGVWMNKTKLKKLEGMRS